VVNCHLEKEKKKENENPTAGANLIKLFFFVTDGDAT
jgi:hypothetical protein